MKYCDLHNDLTDEEGTECPLCACMREKEAIITRHIKKLETLVREMWEFVHPVDRKLFVDRPEVKAILEKTK